MSNQPHNHRRAAAYQAAVRSLYSGDTTVAPSRDEIAHAVAEAVEAAINWQGLQIEVFDGTGWRRNDGTISAERCGVAYLYSHGEITREVNQP